MYSKRQCTLLLCLVVAVLVSTTVATRVVRQCVDKKSYYDGCNTCVCMGGNEACTMKYCSVYDEARKEDVPAPRLPAPEDFWEPIVNVPVPRA